MRACGRVVAWHSTLQRISTAQACRAAGTTQGNTVYAMALDAYLYQPPRPARQRVKQRIIAYDSAPYEVPNRLNTGLSL